MHQWLVEKAFYLKIFLLQDIIDLHCSLLVGSFELVAQLASKKAKKKIKTTLWKKKS